MKKLLSICMATLLLLSALPLAPAAASGYSTQTIMIYMVGTDLETRSGYGTVDIVEMLRSGLDQSRLNVLLMTGGTKTWRNPVIPDDKVSIYKVEGASPRLLHEEPLRSMGEAETLASFLRYAQTEFPADSYGLILWDHGAGPMVGFGSDEHFRHDMLDLLELREALHQSPFGPQQRLEWLAFDACLMGTVEVGAMMAPYARYMISSEELLPGPGFDYGFLGELGATSLQGEEVARLIIDSTHTYYDNLWKEDPTYKMPVTLSLVDLDRVQGVQSAVDALFADMQHGIELTLYSQVARFRDASKVYGVTGTINRYDLVDLQDLADNMAGLYPQQAQALTDALQQAVRYNRSSIPRSAGLAIYFPFSNKLAYERRWAELYGDFGIMPGYRAFMQQFGKVLLSGSLGDWLGEAAPPVIYDEQTGNWFIQLSPEQLAVYDRAEYYVLARMGGEQYALQYASSDVSLDEQGRLKANFGGNILYISDDNNAPMPLPYLRETETLDGVTKYQIPAVLERRLPDGTYESVGAMLLAELDHKTGIASFTGAIRDDDKDNLLGKRDTRLGDWDAINLAYISYYLTRGESGDPLVLGDWVPSDDLFVMTLSTYARPRLSYKPIDRDARDYAVMISVVDTQSNAYPSELMPLDKAETAQQPATPEQPQATQVDFPLQGQQPTVLSEDENTRITLMEVGFSAAQTDDRRAPDTLLLNLLIENLGRDERTVSVAWLSVNGQMVPVDFFHTVGRDQSIQAAIPIPIAPNPQSTGLVDHGIRQVEDIRLRLHYLRPSDSVFDIGGLGGEIRINTRIDVGAGYETPQPADAPKAQLLSEAHGMQIELLAPPTVVDGRLTLPLRITNRSEQFDQVQIAQSMVNGIMAQLQLEHQLVAPGAVLHTRAFIPMDAPDLPPELEEYRALFASQDHLAKVGITQPVDIRLRFELSSLDNPALISASQQLPTWTDFVDIAVSGQEGIVQALDDQGTVLLDQNGLRIVRLKSDPSGRTLYLHNSGDKSLRLSTIRHTYVDDQLFVTNYPIRLIMAPGASAYHQLFSFIPEMQPEGTQLRFVLSVIDLDQNLLLFQSEDIRMELHK